MADPTFPLSAWLGLQTAAGEVAGHGYARQPVTFVLTVDGVDAGNTLTVTWPSSSAAWGTVTGVSVWDGSTTEAARLVTVPTVASVAVAAYERVHVPAGGILLTITTSRIAIGFGTGHYGVDHYNTAVHVEADGTALLLHTFGAVAMCGGQPGDWQAADLCETTSIVPVGYGMSGFGVGPYAATLVPVFPTVQLCSGSPGVWAPAGIPAP